jgi:phosphatidylserine/phosphatidylglycerophosphate/cardiolipin synthase-like enzyme
MKTLPEVSRYAALVAALALVAIAPTRSTAATEARTPAAHRVELEGHPKVAVLTPVQLGETRPVGTKIGNPALPSAHDVWIDMIRGAEKTLDLEQFYLSTWPGEPMDDVVDEIGRAASRGVRVRLLLDHRMHDTYPRTADSLDRVAGIDVRTIAIAKITGSGVQHAKFFLVDGEETWLGSQNFDWRSLKHIHEVGVRIRDASIASEFGRVFDMDWAVSASVDTMAGDSLERVAKSVTVSGAPPTSADPAHPAYPARLPVRLVQSPGDTAEVWTSYSPRRFIPDSTRWDRDAIVRMLDGARREIVLQLLTYGTGERERHDDALDQALRRAARRGVRVKMLISDWMAGRAAMRELDSLAAEPNIEVRLSVIPEWNGGYIPFARVDHSKYVTVDGTWTWVGTSNWEPGYFHGSRNIAVTIRNKKIAADARQIFAASWDAPGNLPVKQGATYVERIHGEKPPPGKTAYGQ